MTELQHTERMLKGSVCRVLHSIVQNVQECQLKWGLNSRGSRGSCSAGGPRGTNKVLGQG